MVWVRGRTRSCRCSIRARSEVMASSTAAVRRCGAVWAAITTESASASSVLRPWPEDSNRSRSARRAPHSGKAISTQ